MNCMSYSNTLAPFARAGQGQGLTQAAQNVLIVDDDAGMREMLALFLEEEGYRCDNASNGLDALSRLRSSTAPPCVILLDLNMPVMTGWEFRQEQQRDSELAGIPVAVISADRSLAQQPSVLDAVGVFTKPIDLPKLLDLVAQLCS
jgi:CheY-like chemotaxis protein